MNQTVVAPTMAVAPVVTIGANFEGADQSADRSFELGVAFDPPDTDGAVGPNAIVELLNNVYRVYDKSGALVQTSLSRDFWVNAGVTLPGAPFDPRVVYDPASQRWFASSSANAEVPGNPILLAVSNTSDPTQGWQAISISSDPTKQRWADFPMLGVNEDGVFIVVNMFVGDNPPMFSSEKVISIPKADLLQPVPTAVNAKVIDNVSAGDTGSFPHPAVAFQSFGPEPLLSTNDDNSGGSSSLKVTSIDGPITSSFLNTADRLVNVTPELQVRTATQKGTNVLLDLQPFSEFTSSVVFQNDKLFAVQGIQHNGLAALRWLEIGDSLTNPVLLDSGIINPPNLNVYDGSIAVNAFGQVLIGFSGSGPNDYPSAYAVAGTLVGDHLQLGDPMLLKAGDGPKPASARPEGPMFSRWGDFSATTVDPVDPTHFWTTEEWAADKGPLGIVWSTEVTEIIFAPPTPSVQSWFGGTGNFSDPQNWSPAGSPAATDTLIIDAGRVRADSLAITNPNIELGSPATTPTLVLKDSTLAAASSVRVEPTTFDPSQPDLNANIRVVGAVTEDGAIDVGTTGTDVNQLFPAHLTISMANGSTFTMDPGAIWFSSDGSTLDVNGPERTAQFINNGEVEAFGGTVRMNVPVTGQGTFDVLFNNNNIRAGTLEFAEDVGAGETVKLDAGLLKLDEPLNFLGAIQDFNPDSTIKLTHTKVTSADYSNGVLSLFDKHRVEAQLNIVGDFTTGQFAITNHDGNAFITLDPSAPVSAAQSVNGVDGLNIDRQVTQFVSAMAMLSASNSGLGPLTTPIQTQNDSGLQSTLAPAWHS